MSKSMMSAAGGGLSAADKAKLIPGNIKKGVTFFQGTSKEVVGTFTSDANAAASQILSGKTAYVNGVKVTGTMTVKIDSIGPIPPDSWVGTSPKYSSEASVIGNRYALCLLHGLTGQNSEALTFRIELYRNNTWTKIESFSLRLNTAIKTGEFNGATKIRVSWAGPHNSVHINVGIFLVQW